MSDKKNEEKKTEVEAKEENKKIANTAGGMYSAEADLSLDWRGEPIDTDKK